MESLTNAYICRELIRKPEFQLKNDTLLLESKIIDSVALLKLVIFLEKQFGFVMQPEELIPENFKTIDTICTYVRSKQAK